MSKIKIYKNFPRDFFTLLYNKLKKVLKAEKDYLSKIYINKIYIIIYTNKIKRIRSKKIIILSQKNVD